MLEGQTRSLTQLTRPMTLWILTAMVAGGSACVVAALGLIGALVARGGFTLRSFGAALVIKDGRNASRTRALLRAIVAWSPVALWIGIVRVRPDDQAGVHWHGLARDPGGRAAGRRRRLGVAASVARHPGSHRRNMDRPALR